MTIASNSDSSCYELSTIFAVHCMSLWLEQVQRSALHVLVVGASATPQLQQVHHHTCAQTRHGISQGRELDLSAADRVGVYRKLVSYMKEHFGDDEWGRRKAFYFLPWHFSFFHRARCAPQL